MLSVKLSFPVPILSLLQKFNAWLDHKLDTSIVPALLVYPEGEINKLCVRPSFEH